MIELSRSKVLCGNDIQIYVTDTNVRLKLTRVCDGVDVYDESFYGGTLTVTCRSEWFTDAGDTSIDSMEISVTTWRDGQRISAARFTLQIKPLILYDPGPEMLVAVGEPALLSVAAIYGECLYRWQESEDGQSWVNLYGASRENMRYVTHTEMQINRHYRCVVSNTAGESVSSEILLTALTRPVVLSHPQREYAAVNSTGAFRVQASGDEISYHWQEKLPDDEAWVNCSGQSATTPELSVSANAENDGKLYRCMVRNRLQEVVSEYAPLIVVWPPSIMAHPQDITAGPDESAGFVVIASGTDPVLQWQYRKNSSAEWSDVSIEGEMKNILRFTATEALDGYQFRCMAYNIAGTVYSNPATMHVAERFSIAENDGGDYANVLPEGDYVFSLNANRSGIVYSLGFGIEGDVTWVCENKNDNCAFHTDGRMPLRIAFHLDDANMIGSAQIRPMLTAGKSADAWVSPAADRHEMVKDFNFNWFSIGNLFESRENVLTASLPCDLTIRYRPIWKDTI